MDYFNSNFKDRLEDDTQGLPEGFAWEDMKDGIEEKMIAGRKAKRNRWWPLLLLLLITGCGGWMVASYFEKDIQVVNSANDKVYTPEIVEALSAETAEDKSIDNVEAIGKTETGTIVNTPEKESNINNTPKPLSQLPVDKPSNNTATNIKQQDGNSESSIEQKTNVEANLIQTSNKKIVEQKTSETNQKPKVIVATKDIFETRNKVSELTLLSKPISLLSNEFDYPVLSIGALSKKTIPPAKAQLSMAILGGANVWRNNLESIQNEDHLSGVLGWSVRPEVSLRKHKWQFTFAYQYDQLQEEFAYEGSTTVLEEREDVVVGNVVNSLTGASTPILKDTTINVTYIQRELKYNDYEVHHLDFSVGRILVEQRKHTLLLNAGLGLTLSFQGNGKRLNNLNLVDEFELRSAVNPAQLLSISSSLQYSYSINDRFSILTRVQFRQFLNSIALSSTDSMRPTVYGLNLGLQHRF